MYSYIDHDTFPGSGLSVKRMDRSTQNPGTKSKTNDPIPNAIVDADLPKQLPIIQQSKRRKKVHKPQPYDVEITGGNSQTKFMLEKKNVGFDDIAVNQKTLEELLQLLLHVKHPDLSRKLGIAPPYGILLHGPPGCGKSLLADAIAGELDMPMLKVDPRKVISGVSGGSEEQICDIFELAKASAPCVIFFDEIDAIAQNREHAGKDMERRIVSQLLTCMDDLGKSPAQVLVIGATNHPDSIDPALRRDGRFAKEFCMGIPNEKDRDHILRVLCKDLKLEKDFNFAMLARLTPGYVGSDLLSLCRFAGMSACDRILKREVNDSERNMEGKEVNHSNQEYICLDGKIHEHVSKTSDITAMRDLTPSDYLQLLRKDTLFSDPVMSDVTLCIEFADFKRALARVQPSAKRLGFSTVPDVTWDEVGALENIRDELTMAILAPVRNPKIFSKFGVTKSSGILLTGPPGCGKTLLAKAVANESGINFLSVKGSDLIDKYVGESEKNVRQCFQRARDSSPCVIFFDELDSMCPKRTGAESGSISRVVNQMLTEMDGLNSRGNVFIMAATNRPDIIDPAVLRPGRFGKTLYVGLPDADSRVKILRALTKNGVKPPIHSQVSLESIARDERCERFTGADLSSLVNEAANIALKGHVSTEHMTNQNEEDLAIAVSLEHFEKAWKKVRPSVSRHDEKRYEKMRMNLEMH